MSGFPQVPPEVVAALAKDNRSPQIIAIVSAFTGLGFVCVVLRFWSRIKLLHIVGMEDYLIVLSMIFSVFTSACLIQGARYGNGKHLINVPMDSVKHILQYLFFSIIAYHVTLTSTKLSILLQYRRIFTLKDSRRMIYIVMGICAACGITAILTAIFTCIPVDAYWNLAKKPTAKCVHQDPMYHANAALNIATDLLVAALPIRRLWTLQIPLRQKIAVVILMTLGWFVVVISVIRLYILIQVAEHPTDTTWYSAPAAYWSAIEVNLAILCASMPALKPLIVRFVPIFGGSRRSNNNSGPTETSHDTRSNGSFIRLNAKPSQSTLNEDQILDIETGVTAARRPSYDAWKEIHVTRSIEQRSVNHTRSSDGSRNML